MSLITDVRKQADTAFGQGRATLLSTQDRIDGLTTDARGRVGSVVTETRGRTVGAVGVVRKQAYSAIGLSDALLAGVVQRTGGIQDETRNGATRLIGSARSGATVLVAELSSMPGKVLSAMPAPVRARVDGPIDLVVSTFVKLADRGEKLAADLRHEPHLARVIDESDKLAGKAAHEVTNVAHKVKARTTSPTPPVVTVTTPTSTPTSKRAAKASRTGARSAKAAPAHAVKAAPGRAAKAPTAKASTAKAPAKRGRPRTNV